MNLLKQAIESNEKLSKELEKRINKIKDLLNMVNLLPDNKKLACYLFFNSHNFSKTESFDFLESIKKDKEIWLKKDIFNSTFNLDHYYFLEKANKILATGVNVIQAIKIIEII